MTKESTIKKYVTFLNDLRKRTSEGSFTNIESMYREYHTSNSLFMHILKLGYFKKVYNGLYFKIVCCFSHDFDPYHAKKLAEAVVQYNSRPKGKSVKCNQVKAKEKETWPESNDIRDVNAIPPLLSDVEKYCNERKNNVSPAKFLAHYEAVGWLVGKKKMKDWKASVRYWENNNTSSYAAKQEITREIVIRYLNLLTDQELTDELKRRGYTGIMEIKNTITF